MSSAKQQMVEIIEEQPEDSSFDEPLRELAFARMVFYTFAFCYLPGLSSRIN